MVQSSSIWAALTPARRTHFPNLTPAQPADFDADQNTIGRYALHFHVISGARIDVSPHVVRNNVVRRSPKHGIVNHGGHVPSVVLPVIGIMWSKDLKSFS